MATTRKPSAKKPTTKKPRTAKAPAANEEGGSRLREAAQQAQRELLLKVLHEQGWNLTHAATDLRITPSAVIQALKQLGLEDEYEAAKAKGLVRAGRRSD